MLPKVDKKSVLSVLFLDLAWGISDHPDRLLCPLYLTARTSEFINESFDANSYTVLAYKKIFLLKISFFEMHLIFIRIRAI